MMESEVNKHWDGVERRQQQLPDGPTALKIVGRAVGAERKAVDESDIREGDFLNKVLKEKVAGILAIAACDEGDLAQKPELTPEQAYLKQLKINFDSLPQLHKDIQWVDVERSLQKDTESLRKLKAFDDNGHSMNVFGEKNGEFIFVSGWRDYNKVSPQHRNVPYDLEGQKLAEGLGRKPTGNALDIAASMDASLSDRKFHRQLGRAIAVNGWAWLKTASGVRETGGAIGGSVYGIHKRGAFSCSDFNSFRVEIRVKKISRPERK